MDLSSRSACPSAKELAVLLNHSENEPVDGPLIDHLGSCEDCQRMIEKLAVDASDWMVWEPLIRNHQVWPADATMADTGKIQLPRVPGYQVLGILGEGGMGIVFKARQQNLNRVVALKMMRSSWRGEREFASRFEEEAKALAQLQHPNLVQIYDVLEHDGCPLLVLEYVDGGSLADRLRSETLSGRDAARLILSATRAIAFAHQRGILHRDIKPANLLLADSEDGGAADNSVATGDQHSTLPKLRADTKRVVAETDSLVRALPLVKVTDFGLARQINDQTNWTRTGEVMGTPSYMPPEQARGDKDWSRPAADIYSLGAVLYEALTGRPPFRSDSAMATLNQLLNEDPVRPSAIARDTPKDLETICLKCLRKDATDRYSTAEALADDLQRFLDRKPILAKRQPFWIHAGKWIHRQPVMATLAASTLIAALVLLVVWARFTMDLQQVNYELGVQTSIAEKKQQEAEKAANQASLRLYEASDILTAHANLLRDDPELAAPAMLPLRERLVRQTLDFYRTLVDDMGDDQHAARQSAALARMGQMHREMGDLEEAIDFMERAIVLRKQGLHRDGYRPENDSSLAVFLIDYGTILFENEEFEVAEATLRQGIQILEHESVIPEMPQSFQWYRLAVGQNALAKVLHQDPGRRAEYLELLNQAADSISESVAATALDADPRPVHYSMGGTIYRNLGTAMNKERRLDAARQAFGTAVELCRGSLELDGENNRYHSHLATSLCYLAVVERKLGNEQQTLELFEQARDLRLRLSERAAYNPRHLNELANIEFSIGNLYRDQQNNGDAMENYLSSARHHIELVDNEPRNEDYVKSLARTLIACLPIAADDSQAWQEVLQSAVEILKPWAAENPKIQQAVSPLLDRLADMQKNNR